MSLNVVTEFTVALIIREFLTYWMLSLYISYKSNIYCIPHESIIMGGLSAKYFELNGNLYTQNGPWKERGDRVWESLMTGGWLGHGHPSGKSLWAAGRTWRQK